MLKDAQNPWQMDLFIGLSRDYKLRTEKKNNIFILEKGRKGYLKVVGRKEKFCISSFSSFCSHHTTHFTVTQFSKP
ncbi:hypothetical protein RJT34_33561 [Clitoria ternatea]|uniref:Uncharacterized protein n=1 Tax=Clitoria ternatea TaxID=43366 RepID=A0AAN9F0E6_CLITE